MKERSLHVNSFVDFLNLFRSCAICQSFIPPINWLCPYCWRKLETYYLSLRDVYRLEKTFSHLRLFDWYEENESFIRPLLNSLKQTKTSFIYRRLALECFSRFVHTSLWPKKSAPVFVPAPPSDPRKANHAFELAKALAFYCGGEVQPLLKKTILSTQKGKNRFLRSQIQFDLTAKPQGELFVFTDDILTTGWTARKAFKTLGSPKNFFICTLAWRREKPAANKPFTLSEKMRRDFFGEEKILYLSKFLTRVKKQ